MFKLFNVNTFKFKTFIINPFKYKVLPIQVPQVVECRNVLLKVQKIFSKSLKSEEGSAIVEFVALGLPLFLPLFIFLANVSQISSDQRVVQSLARQVARAYVTSPDDISARSRVEIIKNVYQSKYFQSSVGNRYIYISINCSNNPCLTIDGKVSVNAVLASKDGTRHFTSSAIEIVDNWRNS